MIGVAVRPAKWVRYATSVAKYIAPPLTIASYSASQSSPGRKPLRTSRSTVLPCSRPSMRYSNAMNRPSGVSSPRKAKRRSGSHAVTVDSIV